MSNVVPLRQEEPEVSDEDDLVVHLPDQDDDDSSA